MDIGMEVEVPVEPIPSTSSSQFAFIDLNNKDFARTLEEWMQQIDSDDDSDFEIGEDACTVSIVARNASEEPAAEQDLTLMAQRVLTAEDRINDHAIRDFSQTDSFEFDWKRDRQIFLGQRETFTGTAGPTFNISDMTSPADIFYRMFDSDFIDLLCTETNRYASQKIALLKQQSKLLPNSRLHRWSPTDRDEMISFLALTILQGLYPLPQEEAFFSFNGFGTMPYFRKIMSYNRYLLLRSLLHFIDNSTLTEKTKLCKIQPMTDYFNSKFSSLYLPLQEIVIDDSLLKGRGRQGFAKKKLTKAAGGIKTYELCESRSGYLWKFSVYAGKDNQHDETLTTIDANENRQTHNLETAGASAKIIYDLIEPLLYRGHTLIMDNLYNSPLFARCLKRQKTDVYGTIRLNREFVPYSMKTLTKTDLQQGEVVATYCSDLSMMVWRDANLVSMISTYHGLHIGTRQKYNRLTYKPHIVLDYNKSMGGIEKKDQCLASQPIERVKCMVWYKKMFRRMFNAALFNCYVLYATKHNKIAHRQFRIIMAEQILKLHRHIDLTTESRLLNSRTEQTGTQRQITTTTDRPKSEHRHFPVKTGLKQTRCCLCAQRKVVARTVWKCLECNVNLCINGCFIEYHT